MLSNNERIKRLEGEVTSLKKPQLLYTPADWSNEDLALVAAGAWPECLNDKVKQTDWSGRTAGMTGAELKELRGQ